MIFSQKKLQKPFRYFLISLVVFICFLFLTIYIYVPNKIRSYLSNNPSWQGYILKVDKASYNLMSGFKFTDIEIKNPDIRNDYVKLNSLNIDIDLLNSILYKKVAIELVEIDAIKSGISKELIEEILSLNIKSQRENVKKTKVELKQVVINNLDINYDNSHNIGLTNVLLRLGDLDNLNDVNFNSKIRVFEKDFSLKSKITRDKTFIEASIDLTTPLLEISKDYDAEITAAWYKIQNQGRA